MPIDEEKREAAGFGKAVLGLRPAGRRVFAMFLRIQGNGGSLWHLSRGALLRLRTIPSGQTLTSIDFKCVTYNDLAAGQCELGDPRLAHEDFTLVVNV